MDNCIQQCMRPPALNPEQGGFKPGIFPIPSDEEDRIALLRSLDVLDSEAEAAFDNITDWGRIYFSVPICVVTLVDVNRQWFKACYGLDVSQTGRDAAFCSHAIMPGAPDVFEVPDTYRDQRFCNNPLVTSAPYIRFYAGAPLLMGTHKLGTLCIIDTKPRDPLDAQKRAALINLAAMVSSNLTSRLQSKQLLKANEELRKKNAEVDAINEELNSLIDTANAPIFAIDHKLRVTVWNRKISEITSISQTRVKGQTINELLNPLALGILTGEEEDEDEGRGDGEGRREGGGRGGGEGEGAVSGGDNRADASSPSSAAASVAVPAAAAAAATGGVSAAAVGAAATADASGSAAALYSAAGACGGLPAPSSAPPVTQGGDGSPVGSAVPAIAHGACLTAGAGLTAVEEVLSQAIRGNSCPCFDLDLKSKVHGRPIHLQVSVEPKRDSSGRVVGAVCVGEDVALRRRMLEATMENYQLQKTNEAKDAFLACMSHEMRTPLNGLLGMLQLAACTEESLPDKTRRYIKQAKNSGTLLLHLINDILDVTRMESGQLQLETRSFSLRSLLEETVELVRPKALEKGLELQLELGTAKGEADGGGGSGGLDAAISGDEKLVGDVKRIEQVCLDLQPATCNLQLAAASSCSSSELQRVDPQSPNCRSPKPPLPNCHGTPTPAPVTPRPPDPATPRPRPVVSGNAQPAVERAQVH